MGKVTRETVINTLKAKNPSAKFEKIAMYADAFMDYAVAADNIRDQGPLVAHPKTGAPIENPYLKIRTAMSASLQKLKLNAGDLWT